MSVSQDYSDIEINDSPKLRGKHSSKVGAASGYSSSLFSSISQRDKTETRPKELPTSLQKYVVKWVKDSIEEKKQLAWRSFKKHCYKLGRWNFFSSKLHNYSGITLTM